MFTTLSYFEDQSCSTSTIVQIVVAPSTQDTCIPSACSKDSSFLYSTITCSQSYPSDLINVAFSSQKYFLISVRDSCIDQTPLYDSYLPSDKCLLGTRTVKSTANASFYIYSEYSSQDCSVESRSVAVRLDTCSLFSTNDQDLNITVSSYPVSSSISTTSLASLVLFLMLSQLI
jgi:hypothetical protein